jgi:hypothetical protein
MAKLYSTPCTDRAPFLWITPHEGILVSAESHKDACEGILKLMAKQETGKTEATRIRQAARRFEKEKHILAVITSKAIKV